MPRLWLCGVVLLAGCTSRNLAGDHKKTMRPPGDEGPHLAVPYFPDRRDQWGPAALAGVLSFWGHPTTPGELRKEVHFPKQPGSVQLDLKYAARARGLEAEMRHGGSLPRLKKELAHGRPVIVMLDIGAKWAPVRAFVVVTGYNEWLHGVYAHWGPKKDFFIGYRQFDEDWRRAGRWFLSIGPKEFEGEKPAQPPPLAGPARPAPAAPEAHVSDKPEPQAQPAWQDSTFLP